MKHISNNIYCVMGVFVKKSNNDIKAYRTMVIRTITDIITKEKENQELALGELTMQELAKIVVEKSRKGQDNTTKKETQSFPIFYTFL